MSQNNGPISRLLSQSMKDITTGKAKATPKMTPTAADYLLGRVTPPTPQQPPNPIRDQQRANTRAVQGIVPQARLANQGMASGAERKAANEARRANTPGTVENTRELVRRQVTQLPIPQEYRVQVESLIDSALHIRTTYLDPATGLRRRVDPLASGQAIRETGMLDPQDAMAVVELLKTEEGIKQLQAEVQMFRDQRVMGSRRARGTDQNTIGTNNLTSAEQREILAAQDAAMRAGLTLDQFLRTPAGASMDLGNLRRLMGRGENIGLLGQAQAEGKSLEDPTFAGLGAVIDRAAEAAPAIRETHRFLRQNPDALTQGVEGLERASTILGLGGPAVAVTRGVLSAVGIDTDSYFKTLDQFNVAVARGAVEGTSAMVRIPQLLGSQTFADLANLADAAVAARDKQKPLDQTFFNETGRVAGGVIPQVAPALLTGGGSAGASAAARIAASVAFAVTEAGANAAGGYNQAIQKGESPMAARRRVAQAMPADIIWSAVLNRLGEFGEIGEAFAKAGRKSFADALKAGAVRYGSASALEGIQEGGQTILEHYIATGEIDPSRPEVLKSMLLGAAVGGAMKGALDLAPQQAQGAEVVPQRSAAASAPPVAESYQAREKEYQVWEARLEELEALLERASGDTMLPNGMPNPMSKAAIQRMISEHRKSRPAFFVIGESQPSAKPKPRTEPAQMPTREQLAAMNVGAEAGQVGDINALRQLQSEIDEWAAYRRSLGLESDPAQQFAPRLTAQDLEGAYAPDQAEPGVIDRTRLAQAQPPAQEPSNPTPVTQSFESTKEWDPEGSQSIAQWEKDRANAMRENPTGLIDILSQEKKIVNQLVDAVAAITVARKLDHDNSGLDPDKISMAWIARLSDFAKARNIPSRLFAKAIQAARDGYANGGKEFILERAQSAEAKSAADEMIAANAANVRQSELEKYNERRAQAVELGIPDEEIDDVLAVELGVYHPDSTRRFNSYTKEWYEEIDHSLATPNEVSQVSEATPPAGPTIDPATPAQFAQVNQGRAGVPNFPVSAVVETNLQDPQARAKAISESSIPGATEAAWSSGNQRIVTGVERIQDAISRVGTSPAPKQKDVVRLLTTMHQVRARAEAAGVDIDPSGELQGIEAQMRDLGYEVDPEFMAAGDAYDTNFKADVLDHIQAEGELRVHQQLKPGVMRDGRFISPPQIITIGYSEYWKPEDDGGNAAQLPPAPDSTLPPDATAPAEMARQRAPQPQQTAPVEQEAKAGAAPWELGRASLRSRRVTKAQMLERGADGYLTSAVKLDIPVSKIDGREPVPEMEGGYQPGTPITQPIEVEYNPDTDTYILYSGNHRVRQAEINGQATIPAFVENFDHKAAVEQAYREGKPVPAEVLAEYGLTPQPTQRAEPAPKPATTRKPELAPDTARMQAQKQEAAKARQSSREESARRKSAEGFAALPERSRAEFDKRMASNSVDDIASMLHPSNKSFRAEFERRTGVTLPSTVSGTKQAVANWVRESSQKAPAKAPESVSPGVQQAEGSTAGVADADGYSGGYAYKMTGTTTTSGKATYLDVVWLEGPRKGQKGIIPRPEDVETRTKQSQQEWREMQDGFRQVREREQKQERDQTAPAIKASKQPIQASKRATPLTSAQRHANAKKKYPGTLVAVRVGDFFEFFGKDAGVAAEALGITLTERDSSEGRIAMAGVPHHSVSKWLERLSNAGYSAVAIDGDSVVARVTASGVAAEPPAQKQAKPRTRAQQRADAKKRDAALQDLVYGTPGTVIEKRGYTDTVVSYDKKQGTVVVSRTEDGRNMGQFTLMGGLDKRDVVSITAPDGTVLYDNRKLTDAAKERVEAMLAPTKAKKPAPNVSRNTQFPVQETMAKPETSKRKKSFGEAVTAMLAGDIYGNRAKAGGEVGINDKWYKGGQFLPVSLKGLEESVAKAKRKASGGDRGVEVFGRAYRKLSPTEIPIIEMLSDQHGFRVGAHYGPELDEGYRQTSPPTRPDGKQDRKRIDELKAQKLGRWRKDERTDEWVWEQRESTKGIVRMVENKEFLSQGGFNADDRAPLREWMPVLEKAIAGFDNTGSTDGFVIDATQYPQFVTINNTFRAIEAGEPLTPEMQKVFLEWMQALPESQRNAFGMLAEEYGVTVPKPSNKIDLTSIAKKPQAPAPAPADKAPAPQEPQLAQPKAPAPELAPDTARAMQAKQAAQQKRQDDRQAAEERKPAPVKGAKLSGAELAAAGAKARAEKSLQKTMSWEGGDGANKYGTVQNWADDLMSRGYRPLAAEVIDQAAVNRAEKIVKNPRSDRWGYISPEAKAEIAEAKQVLANRPTKIEYRAQSPDRSFYDITKAQYDYMASKVAPIKSEPAPKPEPPKSFTPNPNVKDLPHQRFWEFTPSEMDAYKTAASREGSAYGRQFDMESYRREETKYYAERFPNLAAYEALYSHGGHKGYLMRRVDDGEPVDLRVLRELAPDVERRATLLEERGVTPDDWDYESTKQEAEEYSRIAQKIREAIANAQPKTPETPQPTQEQAPAPKSKPVAKTPQRLRYNEVIAEYAKSRGGSVFDGNSPTGRIAAQDAFKQVQKEFPWVRTFGDLDRQAPDILASPSKPAKSKDTITVDGKERPRTNSNGKPIHPTEEGTRAFWRWFGDSKVVDERGRPLVVYHGSPDMRFMGEDATFKSQAERFGGRGESTHAHWFASDTRTAKSYADDRRAYDYQNAEPGVIPAYLQALNPLVIDAQGQYWRDAQRRGQTADVIDEARADGHDGVIIRNVKDDYNNSKATKPTTTLTVFNPTQIKSATGNQGTFSPSNPSILASPTKPRPGAAPAPMVPLTPKPNGGAVPLDLQVDPLASAPGARAISIPEIERAIDDVYGRTHRGTAAKGADGSYSVSSGARWVRDGKFLVGIHEAGHQTSYQAQVIPHFTGPAMDELRSGYFDGTIPDNASQDTADQERFAEFFLAWHINPKLAGKVAPTLRKEFEAIMDAHDRALFKKMNDLSRLIRAYQGQNDVQLAAANFIPAESQSLPSKIAKALKSGTWEKVKDNLGLRLTDEYYPVLAAIDRIVGTSLRKGRELLGSKNPETWIRFIPYTSELLNDGLINGMVDWGVSFRTGKLTRSTGSIKDLFAPLKPKSPEFMSNYTTALGYIAALRQVHYDERLKMDAAAQVAEMQPKAAKKLADRIALAHAQIDRDLQIDLTNLAVQGKATKAATKMLIDAADARKDRATKALTTRSKAGLTRYRNMVLKEAAATAARSGIVAPGANGRTATDIAKGALASIASDPETKAMVEAFAAEIRRHGDWQLSMMEYSGRLSMEQAERIRQRNPYWFPIDRETSLDEDLDEALGFVAGQKIGNAKNVIREFRGSQKSMSDVVGALVKRNADVLAEFHRNMAARTMVDWVEDRGAIGGKAGVFHRVPTEVGIKPKDTQFFVWRNGEKETWEADPGNTAFVAAIKSFSGPRMEDTWERVFWMIFETPTQVNKAFVTNSLPFMVRNLWRDTVHASIKLGLNPIDVFRPKSDFVNQNYDALAIGLGRSTDIVSKSKWERNQAQMIKKASSEEMVIVRPYRVADDLRQESERTPRKAVFDREFKKHMATGHTEVESALMATVYTRNGMTDFRQGGTAVRALSRIVMFLNASVQGTRASLRAYRDDPVRTSLALAKYAGIWLAAEAAWAALGGEDEEKRLEKLDGYQRDMFWNFRIGGDNGWWLTIPKGHDEALGVGIIQRLALRVAGKDASHLQNTLNLARDTVLPMDDASDLFGGWLPSVELGFNRDFRTGKEIVPFYDQGPVHERSGTGYASTLGQALQRAFGNKVDARQWDHLIENSFGYYGRVTTSGSDSLRDGDTDALARAGIRFTGLNLPGRATGNATVLGVENYLRLWSKRPQAWSDAKGAFFDAKTEAERQEAGRKLIALAEKWHDKFESIKDRPKPARELILKTYFEAFKTPQ